MVEAQHGHLNRAAQKMSNSCRELTGEIGTKKMEQMAAKVQSLAEKKKLKRLTSGLQSDFRSPTHKHAHELLYRGNFEFAFGIIILINLFLVIVETDAVAKKKDVPIWATSMSWMVLGSFVVEMMLRIFVERGDFWFDGCNVLDFVLVATDVVCNLIGLVGGETFSITFLRIVRLCKLARVAKAFHVFPELRLMMAGLIGSVRAIIWGTVLLVFTVLVWSIIAVQFIHPLNMEVAETNKYAGCDRCARAYDSVFNAFVTLCQTAILGEGWADVIPMIEHAPVTGAFFSAVEMSVGMAVLNLILGVVVDVASQARDHLRDEIENDKLMERNEVHSHLLEICRDMDKDGNGQISRDELFSGYVDNKLFRDALTYMDITEDDLGVLWSILDDDKSGWVTYTDFVTSTYKLKSSNTHFMLAYIRYYITSIKHKICEEMVTEKAELINQEKKLEKLVRHATMTYDAVDRLDEDVRHATINHDAADRVSIPDGRGILEKEEEIDKKLKSLQQQSIDIDSPNRDLDVNVDRCSQGVQDLTTSMEKLLADARQFNTRVAIDFEALIDGVNNLRIHGSLPVHRCNDTNKSLAKQLSTGCDHRDPLVASDGQQNGSTTELICSI